MMLEVTHAACKCPAIWQPSGPWCKLPDVEMAAVALLCLMYDVHAATPWTKRSKP